MDPTRVQRLHALLEQSTAPDTNLIKSATASLNSEFYRDPACIPGLFEIVASSPQQPVRQIASVELRKRISQKDGALWIKVPQDVREGLKTKIFEVVARETLTIVRHAVSRVIAAIAEIEIATTRWPALLPWLNETTSSPNVASREVGIYVILMTLETIIDSTPNLMGEFLNHFARLLADPDSLEVRVSALRCIITVAQYLETTNKQEIAAIQASIPAMLGVIQSSIEADNSEQVQHGIDGFETLLILETPLLAKSIPQIVEFFTTVGANRNLDQQYRIMSLNALSWVIKYKKSKVQSHGLAKPILDALVLVGAEEEPEDIDEDAPARTAFRAIDSLATALPPSQVFGPLAEIVKTYSSSPEPALRKSALTSLGLSVEGCSEFIRPQIRQVWPLIDSGLQDPVAIVRNAACVALGCLCEWLQEECAERHEVIMPLLMHLVNDTASQNSACTALDAYLEILSEKIPLYIDMIMQRLSGLLETGSLKAKTLVTGAIGSAAHASGAAFKPYFPATLERLKPYFTLTEEGEQMDLRGIAMDTLGTIAEAIGKEDFRPYFPDTMAMAIGSTQLGSARLKECSFLLYGVLARLYEKDFNQYLEVVVPSLIDSLKQLEAGEDANFSAELEAALKGEGSTYSTGAESTADALEDTIESDDELDPEKALTVNSAIAVEKEIAADTLGAIFPAVGEAFLPWLEPATEELIKGVDHYYEGIRKSSTGSLFEFLKTFYALSNPAPWQPGLTVNPPLHDKVTQYIKMVLNPLLGMWEGEDDKTVASNLCSGLAETIAKIGPGMVVEHLNEICTYTLQILERKALCQQDPDQEEDEAEDDEEQAEYESVLISTASDVVGALAAAIGPEFSQAFSSFKQPLFKYYTKNRSVSDRSSSIGCLGEIITGLKSGVTPYTQDLFEHLVRATTDEEAEVRSNGAFALGALVENSEQDLSGQYMNLLIAFRPYFEVAAGSPDASYVARDNAVGAVSRMIVKNMPPPQVEQVLPVIVGALPLRNDHLENPPLFKAIFYLFDASPQLILNYVEQLLPTFAYVLDPSQPDQIGDDVRASLINLLRSLNGQAPDKIAAAGLQAYL